MAETQNRLGLYLHWPYCTRICPYCDFNVYRNRDVDEAAWTAALMEDLHYWADHQGGRPLESLYFGGGTPSLMPQSLVAEVIDQCRILWGFVPGAEITLEANPTDAEINRFAAFAEAGVNRLSLGVQSLRDEALVFLGRNHKAGEARRAIDLGLALFDRLTFDLIYARPDQALADWQAELKEALATGARHLSLYQLTVEPGTAFERAEARSDWALPPDDMQADFYAVTQAACADAGLAAYEVSNYAVPGHEAVHNMLYWQAQDYIGIGPGAHGRVALGEMRCAMETVLHPKEYLGADVAERYTIEPLPHEAQLTEFLSMGLRLKEGVSKARWQAFAGGLPQRRLDALAREGLVTQSPQGIALTKRGRTLLDSVVVELLR